jgi:hypothetical protein
LKEATDVFDDPNLHRMSENIICLDLDSVIDSRFKSYLTTV